MSSPRLVAIALIAGCQVMAGGRTTTPPPPPSAGGDPAPMPSAPAPYDGPDKIFMPGVENNTRADAEESLRAHGLKGEIIATGDTDPKYARDEVVCGQVPEAVARVAPNVTITLKFCNTYQAPKEAPQLVGLSVDDAKKRAVAAGFTGQIEVLELGEYDGSCKVDTVCRVDPSHWELNQEHRMQLYLNRKLKIAVPD